MPNNNPNDLPPPISLDALLLLRHIPRYVRSILLVGARRGEVGYLLKKRPKVQIPGIEPIPELANIAQHCLDSIVQATPHEATLPFDDNHFDAFILLGDELPNATKDITHLKHHLKKNGHIFVLLQESAANNATDTVHEIAAECDLHLYHQWATDLYPALLMLTPNDYNPRQHATECDATNDPKGAYEILALMQTSTSTDQPPGTLLQLEMQKYLLHWFECEQGPVNLDIFRKALELFNNTASHRPILPTAFQYQAKLWQLIGNNDMAGSLLRSIQAVAPNDEIALQLANFEAALPPKVQEEPSKTGTVPDFRYPTGQPKQNADSPASSVPSTKTNQSLELQTAAQTTTKNDTKPSRILFIMHPRIHYGIDVLFDGLCNALGDDNVVDYPYKPTLHGQQTDQIKNYPCTFDRAGKDFSLDEILHKLGAGHFDCILFGDCEGDLDKDSAQKIARAAGIPLFIIDALDECSSVRNEIENNLGRNADAYFKREMLLGVDYGPNAFPLPFAFPDHRIPQNLNQPRTTNLFWAGHRKSGLRKLYLDHLEEKLDIRFDATIPPEEYYQVLLSTRIGLSCFGFGFDTVRYWELPAHGCMLLTERPPIHIPNNFTHEKNALFFDNLEDLEEKTHHYLQHPEEADVIANAGHQHLKQYHTASARANQLLSYISAL